MSVKIRFGLAACLLSAGIAVLVFFAGCGMKQNDERNAETAKLTDRDMKGFRMSYMIRGSFMPYEYVRVDINGSGKGRLTYKLYREYSKEKQPKENSEEIEVPAESVTEIAGIFEQLDFFNFKVNDLNKDKIQVTDAGTTTLVFNKNGKQKELSYGYAQNESLSRLTSRFWSIAEKGLPKSR